MEETIIAILKPFVRIAFLLGIFVAGCYWARARADTLPPQYALRGPHGVVVIDDVWFDASRSRSVPVRIYLPSDTTAPAPVVIFSHGLGNSREGYSYLGEQWASHGFVSVHPEHVGAAHDIEQKGLLALYRAGKDTSYWEMYADDLRFVIDALPHSPIANRIDASRVVVAGHSLGAYAVLALAGLDVRGTSYCDPRVIAGIPISMSENFAPSAYRGISIPLLHITGTHDSSIVYGTLPHDRRVPFDSIDSPFQLLMTIAGANHSTYSDDESPGNRRAHDLIRASTTAFLDAMLRGDRGAEQWLRSGLAGFAGPDAEIEQKPAAEKSLLVGRVSVETTSLFSKDELQHGAVYRVLNHLHTHTHEDLIRRVLLFREGDPYDPMLVAESETNLRRLDFIKSATITKSAPHDGVVDITVRTQDEWTTDPNVDIGHGGGTSTWAVNLTQKDLFGTGAEVSVTDASNVERRTQMLEVLDPVFIRPYWNLETLFAKNSDGGERRILLEQPFYSQTTADSFAISIDNRSLDERLFANGAPYARFHARKQTFDGLFGRALTADDSGSQRLFLGFESFAAAYNGLGSTAFVPAGHREQFAVFGYGFTRTRPVKLDYVDHDAKFDDFLTGVSASLFAGVGSEIEEIRADVSDGVAIAQHGLVTARLAYGTRIRHGVDNEITSAEMRFIWKFNTSHPSSFLTRLHFDDGRNLDGDVQFFADQERGLRGYPAWSFAGSRAFVFNAEERVFLGREWMQLFAPGLAVFVDSGGAGYRGFPMMHTDVGAGLRFSLNRADSTVLRIDVARDLDPLRRRWSLSIGTSQAF